MPPIILPSSKDLAGLKPTNVYFGTTYNATGVYTPTIYTAPIDQIYVITTCLFWFTAGATQWAQIATKDKTGATGALINYASPAVNYTYTIMGYSILEAGQTLGGSFSVTTQPYSFNVSTTGFLMKQGEGVLD
jgi:hypothetical protein